MTLLELRTQFAKQTGRYDLVVPTTFADNGFNYYANQAQRWLDRQSDNPWTEGHYRTTLPAGESIVELPGFRTVKKVWLFNGATRTELRKRHISFLRQQFDAIDTQPATSSPLYFTEVPRRVIGDQQKYGSIAVPYGTFEAPNVTTNWNFDGLIASGGRLNKTHSAASEVLVPNPNNHLTSGRTYLVQCRVYRRSTSGTVTFALGTNSFVYSQTGTTFQQVVANGATLTITFGQYWEGWIDDLVIREVHNEYAVDFESGSQLTFPTAEVYTPAIAVVIYPTPNSDKTWTFVCDGLVYSPTLSADADTSYWTDEHPQTLIDCVRYLLERVRRNSAGKNEKLQDVRTDLRAIEDDMTAGEVAKFTHVEQWREQ